VYRQYLRKWFPIMVRGFSGNVTYAEGFSGPGVYTKGEPGSPVIALRALLDDKSLRDKVQHVRLLFVDAEPTCTGMLLEQLPAAVGGIPLERLRDYKIYVDCITGRCEPDLLKLLEAHGAWTHPMLVVLDTWGGAVSAELLARIAANVSSEVIITIQPQYFSRFADATNLVHGDKVFGNTEWRDVASQPSDDKARWLLQRYRETVRDAGFSHVLDFELVDTRGVALYLVFGTTHDRGLEKMKEAMWEVDEANGMGYRDPRDPYQQTLEIEIEPQTAPLTRLIRDELARRADRSATVHDLRKFALYRTVFKASQVRPVLEQMLEAGDLLRPDGGGYLSLTTVVRLP